MAPRHTPRKQRAAGDYSNLGVVGRRTGAVLEDPGTRDEHGLEPLPAFSSPARFGKTPNGVRHDNRSYMNGTYTADDSMDIDQSTAPDPTHIVRSAKSAKTQRVPRSVSPAKNLMSGKARRSRGISIGRQSASPTKHPLATTPSRLPLSPSTHNSLDRSNRSAKLARPTPSSLKKSPMKFKRKGPYDLNVSDDETDAVATTTIDPSLLNGEDHDEYALPTTENGVEEIEIEDGPLLDDEPVDIPLDDTQETGAENSTMPPPSKPPPRRREDKASRKDTRHASYGESSGREKVKANSKKRKSPFAERDPNEKMKTARHGSEEQAGRPGSSYTSTKSFFQARSETPGTDNGAVTTRSGRTSIKPLAAWRGERIVYAQRRSRDSLPGIQEVVRTEEVVTERKKRANAGVARNGQRKDQEVATRSMEGHNLDQGFDPDDELEPWEEEEGVQYATVMRWDQEAGKYEENDTEETEVGFSATAFEMRDIQGGSFRFAKTLTYPFFGSGIVEVPAGGEKRIKNSRKMQMVFFVHYGRVTVNVGSPMTTFSIGPGGQWMVPRGNFYSIVNESESKDARLFFAQGCQWNGEDEGAMG